MILVDASALAEFLRDAGSPTCLPVDELPADGIAICHPVRMEVPAGALSERHTPWLVTGGAVGNAMGNRGLLVTHGRKSHPPHCRSGCSGPRPCARPAVGSASLDGREAMVLPVTRRRKWTTRSRSDRCS